MEGILATKSDRKIRPIGPAHSSRASATDVISREPIHVSRIGERRDVLVGASSRLGSQQRVRLSGAVCAGLSEIAEDWGLQFMIGRDS